MQHRTFRVFVSSTFSDLKVERNALSRLVYSRLRALCEARGYKFQAVDLRWGVRDEAAADQQTVRICLDEIARCQKLSPKPNFIVLLGDRYGWCPLPSTIRADEMEVLRPELAADAELMGRWYLRDDNAVPAEYVLQPRQGAFEKDDVWGPIERQLYAALAGAAARAGLPPTELEKYRASATELEIMKGAVEAVDARAHVFAFFREIANLEDVKAALPGAAAKELVDALPDGSWNREAWEAQQRLKAKLERGLGASNVWPYQARWANGALDLAGAVEELRADLTPPLPDPTSPDTASVRHEWKRHSTAIADADGAPFPDTTSLCEAVWQRLSRVIALQMDALDRGQGDALDIEKQAHAEFGSERSRGFVGRKESLARIAAYLLGGAARPLVVYGESGSGKSALVARAIEQARAAHPEAVIVRRFIGAAPGASEARPLLESVCRELTRELGGIESTLSGDYDKLVPEFPARLALARPERPAFLFIDALDQLSDSNDGRHLRWLPVSLPPNVRVVVSTLPEDQYRCFPALRERTKPEDLAQDLVQVAPMTADEGEAVLKAWLAALPRPRTLTGAQPGLVLAAFQPRGLPLYLKLAFEEARRWHSYDGVPASGLAPDVPGIIRAMFARLSDQHGKPVVSRALGFLAAARHGLSDDEMLALLWSDPVVKKDFDDKKHHELPDGEAALPPIVWSRLYFDLEPYLAHRDVLGVGLLAFYHRQLAEVAAKAYLVAGDRKPVVHRQLADYFAARWEGADTHALLELVEQLLEASWIEPGRLVEAENVCRNARFLRLRCEVLGPHEVKKELINTAAWLDEHREKHAAGKEGAASLRQLARAVRQEAHWLRRIGEAGLPICFDDILFNRLLSDGPSKVEITNTLKGLELRMPLLYPVRMGSAESVLEGHSGYVNACALSADGKRALSGSSDQTLRVWDAATGHTLQVLEGHSGYVNACALSADGKRALSGSSDQTLRVWDTATGHTLQVLEGHSGYVNACALSADGKRALSASGDKTLRVWDTATGHTLQVLEGHSGGVYACALSADGKTALSVSSDQTRRVWDTATGHALQVLEGHMGAVPSCSLSADGKRALSSSWDGAPCVWDAATGATLQVLRGHAKSVTACALSADGKRALSSSQDKTLRVWDTATGETLKVLEGHTKSVTACALSADGEHALSGSGDKTLRLWTAATGPTIEVRVGHTREVNACGLSADGSLALSGSGSGTLRLWHTGTGHTLEVLEGHTGAITACVLSADGKRALSGSDDWTLRVWQLRQITGPQVLQGHTDFVSACALSADGKRALSASGDKTLRVWDTATGHTLQVLEGHTGYVNACALSADGKRALSASGDKTLRVWDTATGHTLQVLEGHTGYVNACALSADGKRALSASGDKTLRVWDTATGDMLKVLEGHTGGVEACTLSVDGERGLSGSEDKTLRVWDLEHGTCLHVVAGVAAFRSVALAGTVLAAGDAAHNVWLSCWLPWSSA